MYNINDWYWIVGGTGPSIAAQGDPFTGPTDTVYSSAQSKYVSVHAESYVNWLASLAGCGYEPTTRIDTPENLTAVLETAGLAYNTNAGS